MSNLVRNPKDRISRVITQIVMFVNRVTAFISMNKDELTSKYLHTKTSAYIDKIIQKKNRNVIKRHLSK